MLIDLVDSPVAKVALRKESVDRNNRRFTAIHNTQVALRKESVDRNIDTSKDAIKATSRSPQGERG